MSQAAARALTWGDAVERVTRIELALSAWEADVLPLNYTRVVACPGASALVIVQVPVACDRAAL